MECEAKYVSPLFVSNGEAIEDMNPEIPELADDSKELKALLLEKNDLIALLSHDMKTPVDQIKGLAQLMALSLDDKYTLQLCISKMEKVVHHQYKLLQKVLLMLKSEQMVDPEQFETVSFLSLMNTVKENLELDLRNKVLTLKVEVPADFEIRVHPGSFVQALQNLISNSIKFSYPENEIVIKAERSIGSTVITVRDHGIGFESEKADRLFDRFTKMSRRGTNDESSTGLGLYLVKKIVESHRGVIKAHSGGQGKGALFTVVLANLSA